MITGAHVLFYSTNAEADRAFIRDVLGFKFVELEGGWLIFKLPVAEAAVHPTEGREVALAHAGHPMLGAVLYVMCDDLEATTKDLAAKNVVCTPAVQAPWGTATTMPLPSGAHLGLYQPTHPTALGL